MLANEASGGRSTILTAGGCWKNSAVMSLRRLTSYARWVPFREFDESNETYACSKLFGSTRAARYFPLFESADAGDESLSPDTAAFYDAYYKLSRRLFDGDKVRRFRLGVGDIDCRESSHSSRARSNRRRRVPTFTRCDAEHDNVWLRRCTGEVA